MSGPAALAVAPSASPRSGRLVLGVAVAGTVGIALGAFWLSFTSLAALAQRCGIPGDRAWVWPLTVDGVIVVATVSVVAMGGSGRERRAARYPWVLLTAGAGVSVLGNASHAIVTAQAQVPAVLAALVAAVPPVVLVAITHLTVELTRRPTPAAAIPAGTRPAVTSRRPAPPAEAGGAGGEREHGRAGEAVHLREGTSMTNREIAARLGVHPSTVGRWLKHKPPPLTATGGGPPLLEDAAGQIDGETVPHK